MDLFGIGLPELFLILVLALVVLGPERLPEVASQLGRTVGELRRQAAQLSAEFQQSLEAAAQERKQQRLGAAGARYCPSCGAATTEGARYCASCGASLTAPVANGERHD